MHPVINAVADELRYSMLIDRPDGTATPHVMRFQHDTGGSQSGRRSGRRYEVHELNLSARLSFTTFMF